jgi:hypothetical protein
VFGSPPYRPHAVVVSGQPLLSWSRLEEFRMTRRNWATVCHAVALLIVLGLGLTNLARDVLPAWYATARGMPWEQLPPAAQSIFVSYMKLTGGGQISVTLALGVLLLIPFRRDEAWAARTIAGVGCLLALLSAYAILTVQQKTGVALPWYSPLTGFVLFAAGYLLSPRR